MIEVSGEAKPEKVPVGLEADLLYNLFSGNL